MCDLLQLIDERQLGLLLGEHDPATAPAVAHPDKVALEAVAALVAHAWQGSPGRRNQGRFDRPLMVGAVIRPADLQGRLSILIDLCTPRYSTYKALCTRI